MDTLLEKPQNELALTPNNLIAKAIESGAGLEQLEKLMDLQERWEKRQAEKAFNQAMNEFQANKPEIIKTNNVDYTTKSGSRTTYNFVPLAKIQKLVDPVLSKFGLSYYFEQEEVNNKVKITCIIKHVDGHSERSHLTAGNDNSGGKNEIQAMGSTVSYLKRYTLSNALGLSADEDDDGEKTTLTKEELIDRQKTELEELRMEKESKLTENDKKRLDEIIKNEETASYAKAIKLLKTKK